MVLLWYCLMFFFSASLMHSIVAISGDAWPYQLRLLDRKCSTDRTHCVEHCVSVVGWVDAACTHTGKWLDADNKPYQMADPTYMAQVNQPAYPGVIDAYGFLTWLNTDMTKPTDKESGAERQHCCAPRWANGRGIQPPGLKYTTCCAPADNYTGVCGGIHTLWTQIRCIVLSVLLFICVLGW